MPDSGPHTQQWIVRSARTFDDQQGIIQINAMSPFSLNDEIKLMNDLSVDALISKNSGCSRVSAKLDAALQLEIPMFIFNGDLNCLWWNGVSAEIASLIDAIA